MTTIDRVRDKLPSHDALRDRVELWATRLDVRPKSVRVRRMTRKWGSCSTAGNVTLAADLADQPPEFQDFVIAHELLHLRVPNHGKLFNALMTAYVPDWREQDLRRRLAVRTRIGSADKVGSANNGAAMRTVRMSGGKIRGPSRDALADELAAMANTHGGSLILGVDDKTRTAEGIPLEHLDAVETLIRDVCNDSAKPPLDVVVLKKELPDADGNLVPVLCVDVPRSLFVHKSPGGYFRRIGSSKREMSPEALERLFQERSYRRVVRFDGSLVPGTVPDDLNYSLTRRFLHGLDAMPETREEELDVLRKMSIVADDQEGRAGLTVTGVLLCTAEPHEWLPHAYVQAVSYVSERTDRAYQTDARDIVGPLDKQVEEALHFVRRNMLVRATKTTARSERPQFSERAVFEALVNAVAHRDYSLHGARICLHMFGDRLELHVPGALANGLAPDQLHLVQSNRNELVVSLLARCPVPPGVDVGRRRLMDRRGDGVPVIRRESWELAGRLPDYAMVGDSELRLVIWAAA